MCDDERSRKVSNVILPSNCYEMTSKEKQKIKGGYDETTDNWDTGYETTPICLNNKIWENIKMECLE